jgi:hypothetical protein
MLLRSALRCGALFAALGVAACGGAVSSPPGTPVRTPVPTPTPVGLQTPAAGSIYLGAYPFASKSAMDVTTLESQIGRKLAMDMHYYAWTASFPGSADVGDFSAGRLPVDSWNCQLSDAQIVAGAGDLLIETRALAVKSFGHPVFIRYLWDMNEQPSSLQRGSCYDASTDNPDGSLSASEFVLAWQHIRAIFAQEKVTNAIWVWNIASSGVPAAPYYPGDAYVDWVGIDAYDTTAAGFAGTFAPIYAVAAAYHKPILIGETGEAAALQAAFFADAAPALKSQFPLVAGMLYYDARSITGVDWRLTPASGLPAFAALGSNPYFSAFASL